MSSITRTITVTRKGMQHQIQIVEGTSLLPISIIVSDYDILSGSAAVAYNRRPNGTLVNQACTISENTISFTPPEGFYLKGYNKTQVRVTNNNRNLFSFVIDVWCDENITDDADVEEINSQPTLVTQLLSQIGVLTARMDAFTALPEGSTTSDAALNDIRIGYDGTEYPTPGDAVRGQVGSLSEEKVGAYKTITSSAQLSSLAEAEPNKIYLIGIDPPDTLPDFPEEGLQYGTLVTLNHKPSLNDGTIQIFGSELRSKFYIRQAWKETFGKWYQFNFDIGSITNLKSELSNLNNNILLYISEWVDAGNVPDSPYNSADTFPVGSIVTGEYKNISNGAFSTYGQTITLGLKNASYGKGAIQLSFDAENNFYYRINWGGWKEWIRLNQDLSEYVKKSDISMFESVGVIGDSYASGGMVIDGEIVVSYGISWPQILKRKTGVNFVNYSFAGATCKTWISNSSYGLEKLKSDDKRDLYCICMGINDADRQETEPTGTIDDIKDNYEENPDTFFGNMGKIISEIKLKSEKSKIILFTIPKKQSQYVEYSGYIKQIAEKFGLPCADSLTDQFLSSDDYQNNMSGGHPLAVGYSGMANSMENLIENSMLDSYFNDYTGNI